MARLPFAGIVLGARLAIFGPCRVVALVRRWVTICGGILRPLRGVSVRMVVPRGSVWDGAVAGFIVARCIGVRVRIRVGVVLQRARNVYSVRVFLSQGIGLCTA